MKVGVITYHRAHNYGGVLQAYALSKTIEKIGHEVKVIDYKCQFIEKQYKKITFKNIPKLKKLASILIHNGNTIHNGANFECFVKNYISTTDRTYSNYDDLVNVNADFDLFITGSDQVWSPYCSGFDTSYFLDFVSDDRKKNAYAASFGVESIDDKLVGKYKELISSFNSISVRESTGKKIVSSLVNRDVPIVLDPTLLLNKSDWINIVNDKFKSRKYILLYMIAESKGTIELAKSIGEKLGLEVIYISDRLFKRKGVTTLSGLSVNDWLSLFYHANYIVTNSFHGVAFSINFNKDFYVQFLPGRAKTNTRIENIMENYGLMERLLNSKTTSLSEYPSINNYSSINEVLDKSRDMSLLYLSSSLNGG